MCNTDDWNYCISCKEFLMICLLLTEPKPPVYWKPFVHPSWSCKLPYSSTKWGYMHPLLWDSGLSTHQVINNGRWNTCPSHKAIQGRSWTIVIGDAHGNSQAVTLPLATPFKIKSLDQMETMLSCWNTSELKSVLGQEPVWPKALQALYYIHRQSSRNNLLPKQPM